MQPQRLENLSERLLRAGIAPRHVKRYVRELHEHYDDALREELAKGGTHAAAEQAAWTRLGNEDRLAESVLSRPELRSIAARYPRIVFGAGPLLAWIASVLLIVALFAIADLLSAGGMSHWLEIS